MFISPPFVLPIVACSCVSAAIFPFTMALPLAFTCDSFIHISGLSHLLLPTRTPYLPRPEGRVLNSGSGSVISLLCDLREEHAPLDVISSSAN